MCFRVDHKLYHLLIISIGQAIEWEGFIGIERYEQIAGEGRPVFSFYRPKYFAVKYGYT